MTQLKSDAQTHSKVNVLHYEWELEEIISLFELPLNDLVFKAATIHREHFDPNEVQLSTLMSIKTGGCPENCKYCPQSAHYDTGLQKTALSSVDEVASQVKLAKEAGATRFCMGAAWRSLHDRDVAHVSDLVKEVKSQGLEACVTLGMATKDQLDSLKEAGLDFYNHNIDTSDDFYGDIIDTRDFDDRIQTLENIQQAGLHTCSGGIVGMGEGVRDRARMLQLLSNMTPQPRSVPINRLVKVAGTPLEDVDDIDVFDFVRMIAVARILMPQSFVRLSAGREQMSDELQAMCFMAGANSIFYGEKLLTTENPMTLRDQGLLRRLGMHVVSNQLDENAKQDQVA